MCYKNNFYLCKCIYFTLYILFNAKRETYDSVTETIMGWNITCVTPDYAFQDYYSRAISIKTRLPILTPVFCFCFCPGLFLTLTHNCGLVWVLKKHFWNSSWQQYEEVVKVKVGGNSYTKCPPLLLSPRSLNTQTQTLICISPPLLTFDLTAWLNFSFYIFRTTNHNNYIRRILCIYNVCVVFLLSVLPSALLGNCIFMTARTHTESYLSTVP